MINRDLCFGSFQFRIVLWRPFVLTLPSMRIADVCSRALALCRFDLLFRKNPFGGEYTVFAGLEECVRFAANFKFMDEDIDYLRSILPPTCEVRLSLPKSRVPLLSNLKTLLIIQLVVNYW